jgi:hypothetical protein
MGSCYIHVTSSKLLCRSAAPFERRTTCSGIPACSDRVRHLLAPLNDDTQHPVFICDYDKGGVFRTYDRIKVTRDNGVRLTIAY